MEKIRIWDAPTRLFHWLLVALMLAMVITGELGGQAMVWHFRFGYAVLTLVLFRIVWGLIGGRWTRFHSASYRPSDILRYIKGKGDDLMPVGHTPLGAISILFLLVVLIAQSFSGMLSDDEISFAGPLTSLVTSAVVQIATYYHKEIGTTILILWVLLHIGTIVYYRVRKSVDLVTPMITGDKVLTSHTPASKDTTTTRLMALITLLACAWIVRLIVSLGNTP